MIQVGSPLQSPIDAPHPIHYGAGMRGSICGDHGPRLETSNKHKVTCKECVRIIGKSKR